jgi:hypothetical protein
LLYWEMLPEVSDNDDDETLKKLRGGHNLLEWSLKEVEAEDRSKSVRNIPPIAPESSPAASGDRLSEKKSTERVINVDDATGSEIWIPAKEAVKIAKCLSCEVSLPQINKESKAGSFKGRESQSSGARREVELGTFVQWLWRKYQPKMGS